MSPPYFSQDKAGDRGPKVIQSIIQSPKSVELTDNFKAGLGSVSQGQSGHLRDNPVSNV